MYPLLMVKWTLLTLFSVCVTSICRLVALKEISNSSDPTCESLPPPVYKQA